MNKLRMMFVYQIIYSSKTTCVIEQIVWSSIEKKPFIPDQKIHQPNACTRCMYKEGDNEKSKTM